MTELSASARFNHRRDVEVLQQIAADLPVRVVYDDARREFVVSWDSAMSTASFGGRYQVVHAFLFGWRIGRELS